MGLWVNTCEINGWRCHHGSRSSSSRSYRQDEYIGNRLGELFSFMYDAHGDITNILHLQVRGFHDAM